LWCATSEQRGTSTNANYLTLPNTRELRPKKKRGGGQNKDKKGKRAVEKPISRRYRAKRAGGLQNGLSMPPSLMRRIVPSRRSRRSYEEESL